ncbi:MAG: hypothetical protein HY653_01355, partial [Acidobacteria bacterium]|nr:hypothetical protein [Acidobacteriota bacterium]
MSRSTRTAVAQELLTAGVDVGTSSVKTAILRITGDDSVKILAVRADRIRRRELRKVIQEGYQVALQDAG